MKQYETSSQVSKFPLNLEFFLVTGVTSAFFKFCTKCYFSKIVNFMILNTGLRSSDDSASTLLEYPLINPPSQNLDLKFLY